jgi:16S rRNA (cytosine967-C5)-methyltransferase
VPAHAAVSATVDLSREVAGAKPSGLVNAVLRRVAETDWPGWVDRLAPPDDRLGRMAIDRGYPRWVVEALLTSLDGDLDEVDRAIDDIRPVTHLVARPGRVGRDALLAEVGTTGTAGPWSPYAARLSGGDPASFASVRDGRAGVQDEGSQLVALALAGAEIAGRDDRWLDMCAGPGGKTALLAGLLPANGRLLAADRQPHRARLVQQVIDQSSGVSVVVADSTQPAWPDSSFDRVLVDAPCTGLGALRRRPEARWRREPADVPRLAELQRLLLTRALDVVRVGGVVAYATCSPHRGETAEVVDAVRADRPTVEVIDAAAVLPQLSDASAGSSLQLWPHRHGTDAMFVALLRRAH